MDNVLLDIFRMSMNKRSSTVNSPPAPTHVKTKPHAKSVRVLSVQEHLQDCAPLSMFKGLLLLVSILVAVKGIDI